MPSEERFLAIRFMRMPWSLDISANDCRRLMTSVDCSALAKGALFTHWCSSASVVVSRCWGSRVSSLCQSHSLGLERDPLEVSDYPPPHFNPLLQ